MSLPPPNLDDRDFKQLLKDAEDRIRKTCPAWTDFSPGNPGMALLEAFAHLTEVMIYRLNRVPEKLFIEFLRLIGVRRAPPHAARVQLQFRLAQPSERPVLIPRGTVVSAGQAGEAGRGIDFITHHAVELRPGQTEATADAYHAEWIQAEPIGRTTGRPGASYTVRRPPIVAPLGDRQGLVVGVEVREDEAGAYDQVVTHGDQAFGIWREVDDFLEVGRDETVFTADRNGGLIHFSPWWSGDVGAESAGLISAGREVRAWYYRGGGRAGNVPPETLTVLSGAAGAGLTVVNPGAAVGGKDAESIDHALRRGPMELHALNRAVTASDFELIALKTSGAVARARAITMGELWSYAEPGTVQLLLVPDLPDADRATDRPIAAEAWRRHREAVDAAAIQAAVDLRKPLGTRCSIGWARFKAVRVKARVAVSRAERAEEVRSRVLRRLYQTICPLPADYAPGGWPFGQPLHASAVFQAILREPSVQFADQVRLMVDAAPANVGALAVDPFQPDTVYAADGTRLFRSTNGGDGWELIRRFDHPIHALCPHDDVPGLIAVIAGRDDGDSNWQVHVSTDCVESADLFEQFDFRVHDLAWVDRGGETVALIATSRGLYEMRLEKRAAPVQALVDTSRHDQGFHHLAVARGVAGSTVVAVAAGTGTGVWVSGEGGAAGTYQKTSGLEDKIITSLAIQSMAPRVFLWAGLGATADRGTGAARLELRESDAARESWRLYSANWEGGSCNGLAFLANGEALAATHHAGILIIDPSRSDPMWRVPNKKASNLPERPQDPRFPLEPIRALAVERAPDAERRAGHPSAGQRVFAGAAEGVFRTAGGTYPEPFQSRSGAEFSDVVTLPATWLFESGEHEVEVIEVDATIKD